MELILEFLICKENKYQFNELKKVKSSDNCYDDRKCSYVVLLLYNMNPCDHDLVHTSTFVQMKLDSNKMIYKRTFGMACWWFVYN